jgi:hypothetical protein
MKYSLRSLMILVSLVCVGLGGRIAYLQQMKVYHEREARNEYSGFEESAFHGRMALEYELAISRPWVLVRDRNAPPAGTTY